MALDLMDHALAFMADYGLWAIFILLVLDGAMLLPALPGEVVLILAVSQYGQGPGGFILVFTIAVVAAMVGALAVYGVGRAKTAKPGQKRKRVLGVSPKRQEKMERLFSGRGGMALVFGMRLFPLTRIIVSLPAGIARMPFWRFFFVSVVGTIAFYAAFLWLTYEFKDPESEIALTAAGVKAAYGTPAMEYIETNWIITGAVLLLLGIILSIRGSMKIARDHEETSGSLVGTLATAALFWGGWALLAALWLDSPMVFRFIELGGVRLAAVEMGVPYEPLSTVAMVAVLMIILALLMRSARRTARKSNRVLAKQADVDERVEFQDVAATPRTSAMSAATDTDDPPAAAKTTATAGPTADETDAR